MLPIQDVHILIPKTYEYVILDRKRDFADVVEGLVMGRVSWFIQAEPL